MNTSSSQPAVIHVRAGNDRFGEQRGLGISSIAFKVCPQDSNDTLIIENTFLARGGPAKHLHYEQDEWFYALEGAFLFEVGQERFTLHPGVLFLRRGRFLIFWRFVAVP